MFFFKYIFLYFLLIIYFKQADTEESLEKAYRMVLPLLTPMDESQNDWKRKQLIELHQINGTIRNQAWYQPVPEYSANVSCDICGDSGHVSVDCPLKGKGTSGPVKPKIESEYDSFMKSIGMVSEEKEKGKSEVDKSYAEFMTSVAQEGKSATEKALEEFMNGVGANNTGGGLLQPPAPQFSNPQQSIFGQFPQGFPPFPGMQYPMMGQMPQMGYGNPNDYQMMQMWQQQQQQQQQHQGY